MDINSDVKALFPFLNEIETVAESPAFTVNKIPAGVCAFAEGEPATHIALIVSGSIQVIKSGESGRQILLYRVGKGESCILLLSSVLAGIAYPATAITEENTVAVMLPVQQFKLWLNQFESLRNFVYKHLTERLVSIMTLIEEVTFKRMDVRLAELLLNKTAPGKPELTGTHEEIALELGTAREVVSRLLKDLQHEQLIILTRGKITITNRTGLDRYLRHKRS